jgi:hypothetical protein
MVLYLPSTQVYVAANPGHEMLSAHNQRNTLQHNFWRDNKHLQGRAARKLHPNHLTFLKELADEIAEVENGDRPTVNSPCFAFLDGSLRDVLDAVRLLSLTSF